MKNFAIVPSTQVFDCPGTGKVDPAGHAKFDGKAGSGFPVASLRIPLRALGEGTFATCVMPLLCRSPS